MHEIQPNEIQDATTKIYNFFYRYKLLLLFTEAAILNIDRKIN